MIAEVAGLVSGFGFAALTLAGSQLIVNRILNSIQTEQKRLGKYDSQTVQKELLQFTKDLFQGNIGQKWQFFQLVPPVLAVVLGAVLSSFPITIGGFLGYFAALGMNKLILEPMAVKKMIPGVANLKEAQQKIGVEICLKREDPEFMSLLFQYLFSQSGKDAKELLNELEHKNPELYKVFLPKALIEAPSVEIRLLLFRRFQHKYPEQLKEHIPRLLEDSYLPLRRDAYAYLETLPHTEATRYIFAGMESKDPIISALSLSALSDRPDLKDRLHEEKNIGEMITQIAQLAPPKKQPQPEPTPVPPEPTPVPSWEERKKALKATLVEWSKDPAVDPFEVLSDALAHEDPQVGEFALEVFSDRLHTPEIREQLAGGLQSPDADDRHAALVIIGSLGDLYHWEGMLQQYALKKQATQKSSATIETWKELRLMEFTISSVLRKNQLNMRDVESALCMACFTRGKEVQSFDWTHLVCRRCGKVEHLSGGVNEVVGVLGQGFGVQHRGDGVFYVDIWEENGKKFRFADLDVLEIRGGSKIDYDWGLNAILEGLANGYETSNLKLKIRLLNDPPLSGNSLKLIDQVTQ